MEYCHRVGEGGFFHPTGGCGGHITARGWGHITARRRRKGGAEARRSVRIAVADVGGVVIVVGGSVVVIVIVIVFTLVVYGDCDRLDDRCSSVR